MHCLLCKDVVSLRIKEGREEIKKAVREDVWQLGLSPSDPLRDHRGLRATGAHQGASVPGLVWGLDQYPCKVMQGKQPWTFSLCRSPVNYFKTRAASRPERNSPETQVIYTCFILKIGAAMSP